MYYFQSSVTCSLILLAGCSSEVDQKDPPTSPRAKYAKHPSDALQIVEPIKSTRTYYFKDGGTAGLELTDAKDKKHTFSLYPPGGSSVDKEPKFIPNLFVGATHPSQKGAKMVEFRGPEESALYGVLLRMIDKHKEKDAILTMEIDQKVWETRKLWGTDAFELHAFFHRLEGHFLKE